MRVRLALESDVEDVVRLARENIESTRPDMEWDEGRCRGTFWDYIDSASPTIWVAENNDGVVGFLLADMYAYRAASGIFVTQEVLYVAPAYRGSRAALLLMKEFLSWAQIVGAEEIIGGNDNAYKSEQTASFLERFGFERVGHAMKRMENGWRR